jgi:hypothetical protein
LILCYNYGMDRQHDIDLIESQLKKPDVPESVKGRLRRQLHYIKNESSKIKSMREALVKAHKEGNMEEVNDIRNFVSNHRDFRNE